MKALIVIGSVIAGALFHFIGSKLGFLSASSLWVILPVSSIAGYAIGLFADPESGVITEVASWEEAEHVMSSEDMTTTGAMLNPGSAADVMFGDSSVHHV